MIETQELVSALERAAQEAQDVLDVTSLINPDSVSDDELLFAVGNNAVREAASDAVNICGNLAKRLGAALAQVEAEEPKKKEPEIIEKIVEVENTERLEELEAKLKATQEALEARPETVIPDTGPEPIEASYDEPPAEIADLIDPSLTPKQNLDVLTAKFAAAKNLEEYARNNGDMTGAMQHLRDAERFESGIKWNRAVLVEVV